MRFETLETKVIEWAGRRGILEHGKPHSQLLKAVSELGELCDAEGKNDINAIRDAVGDVMVCLINYCALRSVTINDCLWEAYKQIQFRTGRLMPDGTFVKDE